MFRDKKRYVLKYFKQNTDYLAIVATLVFFVLTTFIPNVKSFFVLAFALFGVLTFFYSFPKAIVYTAIPLSYIGIAQSHSILVVPASAIVSNQYWEGRHLSYGFSPFLMISIVALLLIPLWNKKTKAKIKLSSQIKMLIILSACGVLTSVYASLMMELSFFSVFSQLVAMIWVWYFLLIFHRHKKQKNDKTIILKTLFFIISLLIAYESLIVLGQVIRHAPLGLTAEMTEFAPSFGAGSDESGGFRPFGLESHPNGLANNQLNLFFSVLLIFAFLIDKKKRLKIEKTTLLAIAILVIINIFLSLSRAAFIALFFSLLILLCRHQKEARKILVKIKHLITSIPKQYKLVILTLILMLMFKVTNRILDSVYSFSEFGGVSTRITQYQEAIEVFKKSPIWGIGDQMFIPLSYQLFPKGVMSYFPENVHNGFLLFAIERGLLGVFVYALFFYFLNKENIQKNSNRFIRSVIYSGLAAGTIIMLFHPENNLLNGFVLLVIALGNINYETQKKV